MHIDYQWVAIGIFGLFVLASRMGDSSPGTEICQGDVVERGGQKMTVSGVFKQRKLKLLI